MTTLLYLFSFFFVHFFSIAPEEYADSIAKKISSEKLNKGIEYYKVLVENTNKVLELTKEYHEIYKKRNMFVKEIEEQAIHLTGKRYFF